MAVLDSATASGSIGRRECGLASAPTRSIGGHDDCVKQCRKSEVVVAML